VAAAPRPAPAGAARRKRVQRVRPPLYIDRWRMNPPFFAGRRLIPEGAPQRAIWRCLIARARHPLPAIYALIHALAMPPSMGPHLKRPADSSHALATRCVRGFGAPHLLERARRRVACFPSAKALCCVPYPTPSSAPLSSRAKWRACGPGFRICIPFHTHLNKDCVCAHAPAACRRAPSSTGSAAHPAKLLACLQASFCAFSLFNVNTRTFTPRDRVHRQRSQD
jgi:hypothetical protein